MKRMGRTIVLTEPRVMPKAEAAIHVTGFWRVIFPRLPFESAVLLYEHATDVSCVASTCARIGPLATVVNGTSTGNHRRSIDSFDRTMVASARVVSNRAKCSPMHDREPPANGMNCQRSRRFGGLRD